MRLYFLRHGIAEDALPGQPDMERHLTTEGAAQMEAIGRGLLRAGVKIDRIVTSPAIRARETAALAAEALGQQRHLTEDACLKPGCSLRDLQSALARSATTASIMVVGHEPDFSHMIQQLTGARSVEVKKASLVRLELDAFEPGTATLEWLLPPKVLVALGQ